MALQHRFRRPRVYINRRSRRLKPHQYPPQLPILPTELILLIFPHLPDLTTLFSFIQICKGLFDFYQKNSRQITLAILGRHCTKATGYDIGRIYWELEFAIRHDFIKREDIQAALLELGWPLFRSRELQELLLPLVRGLAWSLCMDGREGEAVAQLRTIWGGEESSASRMPTLIPVGTLLAELTGDQQILSDIEQLGSLEERIRKRFSHTVEIRGKRIILHPTAEYTAAIAKKKIKLRLGMQYIGASLRDDIMLVRAYRPPRLPYSNGNTAPITASNLRLDAGHAFSAVIGNEKRIGMLKE